MDSKLKNKASIGTWGYIPPEAKSSSFIGKEFDMWAYGMVLYEMAVAYKPSQVKGYNPDSGEIPFRKYDWKGKSEELKNLIMAWMTLDPNKRISAEDALQHPYFTTQV